MKKKFIPSKLILKTIVLVLAIVMLSGHNIEKLDITSLADIKTKEVLLKSIEYFKLSYRELISDSYGNISLPSGCNAEGQREGKPEDWVSGFFPGSLWYLYELTNDNFWRENAERYTNLLTEQQFNTSTHDLGFMMFNSFGNGYRLTQNEEYIPILLESAKSLASRYNEKVGVIKSWDFPGWWEQFPVIIDNMMNLELLMWAYNKNENCVYKEIAISHSKKTIENHFMNNSVAYHVVDYDTITGGVLEKGTFQGYADSSAWARGQAWALYGFTYMYKETQQEIFLRKAEQIALYVINNLPEDYIPFWDFCAPNIPNEPKDASAGAILASALIELHQITNNSKNEYLDYAEKILLSLNDNYLDTESSEGCGFIIQHNVVSKPHSIGVDVYLNYADYYYLEACKKYLELDNI